MSAAASAAASQNNVPKTRTIHACNFRYAGRLSNENTRTLTSLHEKMAFNIASSLEVYLGTSIAMKLLALEQLAVQDYIAGLVPNSYLLPSALNVLESNFLMEIGASLIFPTIDLLLGGVGTSTEDPHELTDIDEEIMQSVGIAIVQQIERSWRALDLSLTPGSCIKPANVTQIFPANEKIVLLTFEMQIVAISGLVKIALPTSFVGYLLRNLRALQSKKRSTLHLLSKPSLRDRILECTFLTAVDVTNMRVLVKDLVAARPGAVLKMKAPVSRPAHLTVESVSIFEAAPVRVGTRKAAQLLIRSSDTLAAKE